MFFVVVFFLNVKAAKTNTHSKPQIEGLLCG